MATGATESWVTGRPRRKEGPNGAIYSPGRGTWVQKAPNKARNKARFLVPLELTQLGKKPPEPQVPILPDSLDSHIGLGERVRLLLTAVTATSCRSGEGEVRSKTTRTTIGKAMASAPWTFAADGSRGGS